jgi:mannose-6-phosphate isomerase-like protein (cupin superfamily)
MPSIKTLNVLGEIVDVFVDSVMTGSSLTVIVGTTRPGGGPPPHMHTREDETFCVLEGSYEFWREGVWHPIPANVPLFAPRNIPHTFRNVGATPGKMMTAISPGGLEAFFELLSGLSPATDMPRILEIFAQYGLSLVTKP